MSWLFSDQYKRKASEEVHIAKLGIRRAREKRDRNIAKYKLQYWWSTIRDAAAERSKSPNKKPLFFPRKKLDRLDALLPYLERRAGRS